MSVLRDYYIIWRGASASSYLSPCKIMLRFIMTCRLWSFVFIKALWKYATPRKDVLLFSFSIYEDSSIQRMDEVMLISLSYNDVHLSIKNSYEYFFVWFVNRLQYDIPDYPHPFDMTVRLDSRENVTHHYSNSLPDVIMQCICKWIAHIPCYYSKIEIRQSFNIAEW